MPAQIDISRPDDRVASKTPPEHLAIQASPSIMEFAESIQKAFLDSLQTRLAFALGVDTEAGFIRTEQCFLSGHLTAGAPGVHNIVLTLEPLAGCAVLRFSSEVLFKTLDILLASPPAATRARGEAITEIEFYVLRGFFQIFSEALKETWRSLPSVGFIPVLEPSEEFLRSNGEAHALTMKSTLEIDGARGDFDVVIPAFLARLSANFSEPGPDETLARITGALGAAKVEMDAVLSNLTIRIGDLAELTPGQILLAEKASDSTFECLVNKRAQFKGELVSAGDRYGFQLACPAAFDDDPESQVAR